MTAATFHDQNAAADYRSLAAMGMNAARDGFRWHKIETTPGVYDWSSVLPMIRAARAAGVQVIWDLLHYGYPDHLDIWAPEFPAAFARFAAKAAGLLRRETGERPILCPINEISFWSWAGGDINSINPCAAGRGVELKVQLCRASIAAMSEIHQRDPEARFVHAEPVINIIGNPEILGSVEGGAEAYRLAQFQAWDIVAGNLCAELGGRPEWLDIVGLNYYPKNQWVDGGGTLRQGDPGHKPLREIILEVWCRYGRPLLISETGAEDDLRGPWLRSVIEEVDAARRKGARVLGVCLYPIIDHPGWEDDRACACGLFGAFPSSDGSRAIDSGSAVALAFGQQLIEDQRHICREAPDTDPGLTQKGALGV